MLKLHTLVVFGLFFVSVAMFAQAPATPTGLVVSSTTGGAIALKWDKSTDASVTKYKVYYSASPTLTPANTATFVTVTDPSTTTASVPDPGGTPVYFVLTALNATGESVPTLTQSATAAAAAGGAAPVVNGAASPSGAATAVSSSTPDSNVTANPNVDSQNPDVQYTQLTALPAGLSSAGALVYDQTNVKALINQACSTKSSTFAADVANGQTYTIFHIVHFDGAINSESVKNDNWYVYSEAKDWKNGFIGGWKVNNFNGQLRLYGATKVFLVSILLNDIQATPTAPATFAVPTATYAFTTTKQDPTNVADVKTLLSMVGSAPNAGLQAMPTTSTNWIGCAAVPIAFKTSTVKIVATGGTNVPAFSSTQAYTNEGKTHWDVSFALPIKKASALQYSTTNNTVTASQINKSDLFAVFDFYPVPVDLKATSASLVPSFFAGVALNSQPLHSFIFGTSVGIHLAQIYVGGLLLKQQQLNGLATGDTATANQVTTASSYSYKPSFTIGIKISIRSAASSLSTAASK